MKTQYKHIHFNNISALYPKRKTQTWNCCNNSGIFLGIVAWNSAWRQYCFYIEDKLVFSIECLSDIVDFIEQLKKERRNAKTKKR